VKIIHYRIFREPQNPFSFNFAIGWCIEIVKNNFYTPTIICLLVGCTASLPPQYQQGRNNPAKVIWLGFCFFVAPICKLWIVGSRGI
jgi:hypothetical protein